MPFVIPLLYFLTFDVNPVVFASHVGISFVKVAFTIARHL